MNKGEAIEGTLSRLFHEIEEVLWISKWVSGKGFVELRLQFQGFGIRINERLGRNIPGINKEEVIE